MLHTQLAAFALAVAVLIASGCGSSKSRPMGGVKLAAGKPLTREQLIVRGDAICAHTLAQVKSNLAESRPEIAESLPRAAIYLSAEAENLSKLVPPASMSKDWSQIVDSISFAAEDVTRAAQYIKKNQDDAAGRLYTRASELNTQSKEVARKDGFKRCSSVR